MSAALTTVKKRYKALYLDTSQNPIQSFLIHKTFRQKGKETEAMETIPYRPLNPSKTEIRLIELYPRPSNVLPQQEVAPRCNLFHVSLYDKPDYVALSYTWGDPRDTEKITVGEVSVSVTRNLRSALEHLQYANTARILWIDALCINQSDIEEKGWQVQLMREIYQRAAFVSIWLGPADTTSDEVMEFLKSLGKEAMRFDLDRGPGCIRDVSAQWRTLATTSNLPSFRDQSRRVTVMNKNDNTAGTGFLMGDLNNLYFRISGSHEQHRLFPVEGMASLFKRAWWGRIWVLKELTLAQKAGFICGTKLLSRRSFTAALNAFEALKNVFAEIAQLDGIKLTKYQKSVVSKIFWRPKVLLNMWETNKYSPYPLLALLRATCISGLACSPKDVILEATDPRDKIYGILGLAVDRDELKELGILPDYTRSKQDVYIHVTAAILRQGHISVLSFAHFSNARVGLPSWVTDWSQPLGDPLQGVGTDHMTPEPGYNASGSLLQMEPSFAGIGATMSVSVLGFVYDEVYELGSTWTEIQLPFMAAKRLLEELVRLSFVQDNLFKDLKERISAVARTVTAEIGYNDNGRWARIGNQRYHTAVSIMMLGVNSPCQKKLLDSGLLDLIKCDRIQTMIDQLRASILWRDCREGS
jgi:hypothetical protein